MYYISRLATMNIHDYQMRWEKTLPEVSFQYPQDNVLSKSRALRIPDLKASISSITPMQGPYVPSRTHT